MQKIAVLMLLFGLFLMQCSYAQQHTDYTILYQVEDTEVKNQGRTGTCWSFATISFLESEVKRLGGPALDLSEMFIVRHTYPLKAEAYIRRHGNANFSEGGQAHDVLRVLTQHGIVPESAYTGLRQEQLMHNHAELQAVMKGFLDALLKGPTAGSFSDVWKSALASILDAYLGAPPTEFTFDGKTYTPPQFASDLAKIDPNDYVELTSYQHLPFYSRVLLEIPDNWANQHYSNVPIDELMRVMDNALQNGFSVCWDGDMSHPGFDHQSGRAVLSSDSEPTIDQAARQQAFDRLQTTDDHLMHIVGIAKDGQGNKFYLTKNSWDANSNSCGGYLYMSEAYVRLQTVAILVHREAIPSEIARKFSN